MLDRLSKIEAIFMLWIDLLSFAVLVDHARNDFINGEAFAPLESVKEDTVFELSLDFCIPELLLVVGLGQTLPISLNINVILDRDPMLPGIKMNEIKLIKTLLTR